MRLNREERAADESAFADWMRGVDAACVKLCGLSVHDLPDVCFRDYFDDGESPASVARKAIRYAQGGDL